MKRKQSGPPRVERAGLYVRVSLDRSARGLQDEILSPETQEDRARQYCGAQGWPVETVERDIDESGYRQHYSQREGLVRLLDAAESGTLTKIVVWKFSRLSRRLREFIEICDRVEAAGAGVVSVTEQVDTSTPAGRLIRNILASFAQFQSEEISEQIFETWLTKARRGERPPGAAPFGTLNRKGVLEPDPDTHSHLLAIFRTYLETASVRAVWDCLTARAVPPPLAGEWNLTTIRGILANPVYIGRIEWAGQLFEGRWSPLVPPDLWQGVQDLLASRRTGPKGRKGDHLLTGLVQCGLCGRTMWTRYTRTAGAHVLRRVYWCCSHNNLRRGCRLPALDGEEAEAAVWDAVAALLKLTRLQDLVADQVMSTLRRTGEAVARPREAERERVAAAAAALAGLLAEGSISREQYARQNERYQRRLRALEGPPKGAHRRPPPTRLTAEALASQALHSLTQTEKRQLLMALEASVSIQPHRVELRLEGGLVVHLKARRVGEVFHFGQQYQRLDCQASLLTDKQLAFICRTYRWAPKKAIAAKLGRSYATLVTVARRLRLQGLL